MTPLTQPPLVLLVEDDDGDALLIQEGFAEAGTDVSLDRIRSGDLALAAMREIGAGQRPRPDLVLLDLNLPGVPGVQLLRFMKGSAALREIPVVVLTTSTAERDVREVYAAHGNAYVTKPVQLDAFLATIHEVNEFWVRTAQLPA